MPMEREQVVFEGNVPFHVCLLENGHFWLSFLFGLGLITALLDSWGRHVKITNQRIIFTNGLLARRREQVEFVRIRDIAFEQTVCGRVFSYGSVILESTDSRTPHTRVFLPQIESWSDWFRNAINRERVMRGVRIRELS